MSNKASLKAQRKAEERAAAEREASEEQAQRAVRELRFAWSLGKMLCRETPYARAAGQCHDKRAVLQRRRFQRC